MSKAILVIGMPNACIECPFYDTETVPSCLANMNFKGRTIVLNKTEIQHFCPLKPLPRKMNAREKDNMIVSIGWNLCLDEILNENNVYEIEIKDSKYQKQIDEVLGKDMVDKFFKGEE